MGGGGCMNVVELAVTCSWLIGDSKEVVARFVFEKERENDYC